MSLEDSIRQIVREEIVACGMPRPQTNPAALRIVAGLDRSELAKLSGVSESTIGRLETGKVSRLYHERVVAHATAIAMALKTPAHVYLEAVEAVRRQRGG
jgi:transcriptional regulator with XRE-family HTH domain